MADNLDSGDEDDLNPKPIRWTNIIFLPFHPTWKCMMLLVVIIKCTYGPLSSIYTIHCMNNLLQGPLSSLYTTHCTNKTYYILKTLAFIDYFYIYLCNFVYVADTFLFIVHRQVKDEAVKREHSPKSACLLLIDMLASIPFYQLFAHDLCAVEFWPNIMVFNEVLVIYRVVEYFSLGTTHSTWKLIIGCTITLLLYVNTLTCFLLLLTKEGLCGSCRYGIYDWRSYFVEKLNTTNENMITFMYGSAFALAITVNTLIDETKPSTYLEFVLCLAWMLIGYIIIIFIVIPKLFAEGTIRIRQIYLFHPRVKKIIEETKRRNASNSQAHLSVERFYSLIWTKRNGITALPSVISELPRYLIVNIRQNLVWPVFYHSPTLRKTSMAYKRWLCEYIKLEYKLPGEMFYTGPNCYNNLYYIKSGIIQLISSEDNITSILSVTGGTIFGDISFLIPPRNRKMTMRCLTYCEVFSVSRAAILKSLHKFPEDRRLILNLARERIKHAYTLYNCKSNIRGLDRADDEGIAWVKRRWWEVYNTVKRLKNPWRGNAITLLPPEETNYHCAKFIGQLVLSTNVQLQRKSLFVRVKFPWMLAPHSIFGDVWHQVVKVTVYLILLVLPPAIAVAQTNGVAPRAITYILFFTDLIYLSDIFVSLITGIEEQGHIEIRFMTNMFQRCKKLYFILDVFATIQIEDLVTVFDYPDYYHIVQFNRLIKTYMLFVSSYKKIWEKDKHPINQLIFHIVLVHFWFGYVIGFFTYVVVLLSHTLTPFYFYGDDCDIGNVTSTRPCTNDNVFDILASWIFEIMFAQHQPKTIPDVCFRMGIALIFFLMGMYTKSRFMSILYLKNREILNYYYFVSNLKQHFISDKIHPYLLRRLERYLVCQWKYYKGVDVLYPNIHKELPHDIYWKLQGQAAEKIIADSGAFIGADPAFIKELAYKAKFLILPKNAPLMSFGIHAKNLSWIFHGTVMSETIDEEGNIEKYFLPPGSMLAMTSVLMGKGSLRNYTAVTDIEILYISTEDYKAVLQYFPVEQSCVENSIRDVLPLFESTFQVHLKRHREHRKKLHHASSTASNLTIAGSDTAMENKKSLFGKIRFIFTDYRSNPESQIIQFWVPFRVITVIAAITSSALQGGSGVLIKPYLINVGYICDIGCVCDIILKIFVPYYNKEGLVISDIRKCAIHYLTRNFIADAIGALPWVSIFQEIMEGPSMSDLSVLKTLMEFSHLYIITGYFNYLADKPTVNMAYIMIFKWHLVTLLVMIGASHMLVGKCIEFHWDDKYNLVDMTRRNSCWMPSYLKLDDHPTILQLHQVFAESLSLAQCAFLMINLGQFYVNEGKLSSTIVCFLIMGVIFWCAMCYCKSLLVLYFRGNTLFQHGVDQLRKFLKAERVPENVIQKAINHFVYIWIRTKGINEFTLMNERIGAVFRQDLSYFFYKKTFAAVDSLLGGGEVLERQLASNTVQVHFLPDEDIIREMQLSSNIYIVHRGKVVISKNDQLLAVLKKGSIFGQLHGEGVRPIQISARTQGYADLMQLSVEQFGDIINDDIKENIIDNPQSQYDFMSVKKMVIQSPYNTIEYILRDRKLIRLPWMSESVSATSNAWYARWLFCVWLLGPVVSAVLVLIFSAMPRSYLSFMFYIVVVFDVLHVLHLITELFTMEVVVDGNKCVKKYIRLRRLLRWGFYLDIISLILPLLTLVIDAWDFQIARLLRVYSVYFYYQLFCKNFQTRGAAISVKFLMVLLLLHALTCGWISIACRQRKETDIVLPALPISIQNSFDYRQWALPHKRSDGCLRITKSFSNGNDTTIGFVVAQDWYADYIIAIAYIIIIHTHTNMDVIVPVTLTQIYYNVFITVVLYLVEMWTASICISIVYTKLREMYFYDYQVANLITYLKQNGISQILLESVKKYTSLLWQRQRGNWLPEITRFAPACLREDILSALYMHHFASLPVFKNLPMYFLRQLVVKLNRVMVFPSNYIVQEGDVYSCIYFIHQGEVEKLYTDANGERRMQTLLIMNEHFGFISGLFPDVPFKFSYYTRTVVDLVYLRYEDWQDLLNSYPDIKEELYGLVNKLKTD